MRGARLVIAAVLALGGACLNGTARVSAEAAAGSAKASTGIAKFGACMSGKKTADVVILLDESGSLKTSDPAGARVDAAQYLVKQWSALSVETDVKIAIQTMGFSAAVSDRSGKWLDAGTDYPVLKADLEAFRPRNTGTQTDYWMALDGARKVLAERAQKGGSDCQAILWFSDGKLDAFSTYLTVIDGKKVEVTKPYLDTKETDNAGASAAASKDLCRTGGVADQVRSSGIATFAVGLAAGDATPADFDLMKSIALGENGCGAVSASGTGDFHLATDIDELILAFESVRTPGQLPIRQRLGVCQGKVCPAHSHRFVLDDSITRVHITASASVPGLKLFVVPPDGKAVELPMAREKTTRVGAATVVSDGLSARTMALDFTSRGRWTGVWSVVFVDPDRASGNAKSITNLELSADLEPSLTLPRANIYAGEKSPPLTLGLRHHDGRPVEPSSLLGTLEMGLVFTDSAGKEFPVASQLDAAALSRPLVLDLTEASEGIGTLTATVVLTTAAVKPAKGASIAGTKLTPQSADTDVKVMPPPGYPIIDDRVSFGTATGPANLEGTLKATGPGCVWFDPPKVTASPEKAGAVDVTSSADSASACVRLAEGESKDIPIRLTTAEAANGSVNGSLTAHLMSETEPDRVRTKPISFAANLDKKPVIVYGLLTFVIALVLGIGIPVALMYLVKRMTSKIPPLPLVAGIFDVSVEGGQVLRDGMPFALQPHELRDPIPVPVGGASSLTVVPAKLRVRNGWSPFGPGRVLAAVAGSVGTSATRTTARKDGAAELPLAVHNNWALFNAPERGPGNGRLLLLVGGDASQEKKQDLISRALSAVPERLQQLGGTAPRQPDGLRDPGGAAPPGPTLTDPDATWTRAPAGGGDPWEEAGAFGSATTAGAGPWQAPSSGVAADANPWSAPVPSAAENPRATASSEGPSARATTPSEEDPWAVPTAAAAQGDPWASPAAPAPAAPQGDPWASPAAPAPAAPQGDPWASAPEQAPGRSPRSTDPSFDPSSDKTMPRRRDLEDDPNQWPTQPRPKPSGEPPSVPRQASGNAQPSFDFSKLDENPDPSN